MKPGSGKCFALLFWSVVVQGGCLWGQGKPVHVFLLAGESNMEGQAPNELFEHQAKADGSKGLFEPYRQEGRWTVRDDVFIQFLERHGPLTLGFGSPGRTGVELAFGTAMGNRFEDPVVLVKGAWGGRSLGKHFRPPSAGFPEPAVKRDLAEARARVAAENAKSNRDNPLPTADDIRRDYGESYRRMLAEVNRIVNDPGAIFPELAGTTPQLAGLVWFQGWSDQNGFEDEYASNLRNLIKDVRRDLQVPTLPVVIAAMGQNGSKPVEGFMRKIQEAQLSMNDEPEFQGTVKAIPTDTLVDSAAEVLYPQWKENPDQWKLVGGDHPYHYLGSAVWFTRIGTAMAEAMSHLISNPPAELEDDSSVKSKAFALTSMLDPMAMAFSRAEDEIALDRAMAVLEVAPNHESARAVVEDLARRRKLGTFGKEAGKKPPADIDKWVAERRIGALIEDLEQVAVEQSGWPGGVDLSEDWRVDALIRIGDPAVSPLIEVIENDGRLTRSVHCWRMGVGCTILAVREAALTAVMSILQTQVFEAGSTGDNFTGRGAGAAKKVAAELRAYWESYGKLPFDERLMAIIQDPTIVGERLREAVSSLAWINDRVRLGTTVWTGSSMTSPTPPPEHPAIAKFSAPTAAEAIVAAMKRDFAALDNPQEAVEPNVDPEEAESRRDYERSWMERVYASAFLGLGDPRIASVLVDYAHSCPPRQRVKLSFAAHQLGDSSDLESIAILVEKGKWNLADESLADPTLELLAEAGLPKTESALWSLRTPRHRYHLAVVEWFALQVIDGHFTDRTSWLYQPFVLPIMRRALDNRALTGWRYVNSAEIDQPAGWDFICDDALPRRGRTGTNGRWPATVKDFGKLGNASETVADRVAQALGEFVWTLPFTHPLLRDNPQRLDRMKADLYRFQFRLPTPGERGVQQSGEPWAIPILLIPDIPPLDRPASRDDVAAGRAIFTLDGPGRRIEMKLPAQAVLAADAGQEPPRTAIIVQAEKDAEGVVHYGVLFRGGWGKMTEKELADVSPLEEPIPAAAQE